MFMVTLSVENYTKVEGETVAKGTGNVIVIQQS
jgi:hypothetical protein